MENKIDNHKLYHILNTKNLLNNQFNTETILILLILFIFVHLLFPDFVIFLELIILNFSGCVNHVDYELELIGYFLFFCC